MTDEARASGLRLIRRVLVVFGVALALNIAFSAAQFFRISQEGNERRHQICLAAEREHLAAVDRLKRVYAYLTGDNRQPALDRVALAELPRTEEQARWDVAPEFCDVPGLGLPEPDPVVPGRPAGIPPVG
jgi:hypothetical protein